MFIGSCHVLNVSFLFMVIRYCIYHIYHHILFMLNCWSMLFDLGFDGGDYIPIFWRLKLIVYGQIQSVPPLFGRVHLKLIVVLNPINDY
jgi:hypothetical protein